MINTVLVDAGPLVALLDRSDPWHDRCRDAFATIKDPLATVWPAFTEAMYLLGFSWRAQAALWEWLETPALDILPLTKADAGRMKDLMQKYQDLPMDLADAGLVCVAEREKIRRIFTIDRRHFGLYRPSRLGRFILIP